MISISQTHTIPGFINTLINKFRITDEFVYQKEKACKRGIELALTKKTLLPKTAANKKRADELIDAYNDSNKGEEFLKEYVHGLEEMMFMTHHKVRQPVANILGMASLIEKHANSPDDLKKIVEYMKQSALNLDEFTRELTTFISDLEQKGKNKNKS